MELPQTQFFDVKVVAQFLDKVLADPVLRNDSVVGVTEAVEEFQFLA